MRKDIWHIEESLEVERSEWPVLRAGWLLMALFVLAGLFGFFGTGIFSNRKAGDEKLMVRYDRFLRYSMSSEVVIKASSLGADSSVLINADYTKKVKIDDISPQPDLVKLEGNSMRIKFNSRKAEDIILYIHSFNRGSQKLEVKVNGRKIVVRQFVYI